MSYQPDNPSHHTRPLTALDGAADLAAPSGADFAPLGEEDEASRECDSDDPHLGDSLLAQEVFDRAVAEAAAGNEDAAVAHFLRASKLAEAAREWFLAASACHRVGDFLSSPKPPCELERALRMYRRAVAAYEQCGLFAEARALSYRVSWLKARRGRQLGLPWRIRLELWLYWLTAGFGLRPLRVAGTAAAVVLAYALLYWGLGGVRAAGPAEPAPGGFWDAVYFSGVTFATVGYGDFVPAPHVRLLALTEGAVGAFTVSFFVVVLSNRLRH